MAEPYKLAHRVWVERVEVLSWLAGAFRPATVRVTMVDLYANEAMVLVVPDASHFPVGKAFTVSLEEAPE